jgi:predicted dehydrogenase
MEKKIINIAQIGVGYWGPNLLRNFVANKKCSVKKVVDLSKERRLFVNSLYPNIATTDNINEIISDKNIDAVIIATPVVTHLDLSLKCLNSGKHILVEKPMARTKEEVEQIDLIAKEKGLVAMVGHTFLFNSAVHYVKKFIESNQMGDIHYIYSQRLNLGRIREDVDALWNLAPHDISIIQYWLNDPDPICVRRNGMSYVQPGIDDVVFLNIEYPKNILANIHVSWLDPRKIRRMTVVGSKKMVVYDDLAEDKVIIYDKGIDRLANLGENMDYDKSNFSPIYNYRSGDIISPKIEWVEPLKAEVSHFIDCIFGEKNCLTDTVHAGKVVSILESGIKNVK